MGQPVSVYFSSAGRRVELMRCFRDAMRDIGGDIRIIAGDIAPEFSAACAEADVAVRTPHCSSPEFIDVVLETCLRHDVKLVIPTIDPELILYSRARSVFKHHGVTVAVSDPEVVKLAQDKLATALWLSNYGIRTPVTYDVECLPDIAGSVAWPLLMKPKAGSASKGIYVAENLADVRLEPGASDSYVAQALLQGDEYTTNIFFDRDGVLRAAVPHIRYETRGGEVSKGETVRSEALLAVAVRLGEKLRGARGPLCFQAIVDADGTASIFEINARFGGGYPLAQRAGAPFARWLLLEATGGTPIYQHQWKAGLRMLRYDSAHFTETQAMDTDN